MDHRALITGSTRGIGRATARALLLAGARVTLTGREEGRVNEAMAVLAEETGAGDRIAGQVLDVRVPASVDRAVSGAVAAFGGLDVVVNNAGVGIYGDLESVTDEDWSTVMQTNVAGPFHVIREAIPALRQSGGGWIVNIASLAGAHPFAGGGAYCASKAALLALSESAMQELRADNIRVSVVLPGSTATGFSGRTGSDETWRLSPDDVAAVVTDLLRHPARSLPSRVEIRPSRPKKG
jgi:NAD(P)-dependent dehydrogenase (short-subunit alcohol dehydrogenase family)